jgi:hypothetical protein
LLGQLHTSSQTANHQGEHVPPEFQPDIPMFGAIVNTHASDRGNEPVTWNQFHTFANQMDTNFSIVNSKFISLERRILELDARFIAIEARFNELDAKIIALRGEFLEFKEEMRLVPVKIAGWVAGAMIGSASVIFGGFQLLRGLL